MPVFTVLEPIKLTTYYHKINCKVYKKFCSVRSPMNTYQGSKLTTNWSHMRLDFWLCA